MSEPAPEPPSSAELIRAFHLLLHDMRAPLGVAHGFLRLLREGRVASTEERDHALAGAIDALARLSKVCGDGSALVQTYETAAPSGSPVQVRLLTDRLVAAISPLVSASASDQLTGVTVVSSVDSVTEAAAVVIGFVLRTRGAEGRAVAITQTAEELVIVLCAPG
jgi:hypothetical protein